MKVKFVSITTRIAVSLTITTFIFTGLIVYYLYTYTAAFVYTQSVGFTASLVKNYWEDCKSAIQSENDLMLTTLVQRVKQNYGIIYVLVLDPEGKVVAHNDINQYGKKYTNLITLTAMKAHKPLMQHYRINQEPVIDFSFPIYIENIRQGTLRIGLSTTEIQRNFTATRDMVILLLSIFLLLTFLFTTIYLRNTFTRPWTRLVKSLDLYPSVPVENNLLSRQDEFGRLARKLNSSAEQLTQMVQEYQHKSTVSQTDWQMLLSQVGLISNDIILRINNSNRLEYYNLPAEQVLHLTAQDLGKHFLELFADKQVLECIQSAINEPGTVKEIQADGMVYKTVTLPKEKTEFGTLLVGRQVT